MASAKLNSVKLAMLRGCIPDALDSRTERLTRGRVVEDFAHLAEHADDPQLSDRAQALSGRDRRLLELTVCRGNRMSKS